MIIADKPPLPPNDKFTSNTSLGIVKFRDSSSLVIPIWAAADAEFGPNCEAPLSNFFVRPDIGKGGRGGGRSRAPSGTYATDLTGFTTFQTWNTKIYIFANIEKKLKLLQVGNENFKYILGVGFGRYIASWLGLGHWGCACLLGMRVAAVATLSPSPFFLRRVY